MSSKCNRCDADITWKKPFTQGDRPLNLDNSVHSCKKPEAASSTPTGITNNSISAVTVLAEIEAFRQKFGPIESDARFESLAKIYISRMMRR